MSEKSQNINDLLGYSQNNGFESEINENSNISFSVSFSDSNKFNINENSSDTGSEENQNKENDLGNYNNGSNLESYSSIFPDSMDNNTNSDSSNTRLENSNNYNSTENYKKKDNANQNDINNTENLSSSTSSFNTKFNDGSNVEDKKQSHLVDKETSTLLTDMTNQYSSTSKNLNENKDNQKQLSVSSIFETSNVSYINYKNQEIQTENDINEEIVYLDKFDISKKNKNNNKITKTNTIFSKGPIIENNNIQLEQQNTLENNDFSSKSLLSYYDNYSDTTSKDFKSNSQFNKSNNGNYYYKSTSETVNSNLEQQNSTFGSSLLIDDDYNDIKPEESFESNNYLIEKISKLEKQIKALKKQINQKNNNSEYNNYSYDSFDEQSNSDIINNNSSINPNNTDPNNYDLNEFLSKIEELKNEIKEQRDEIKELKESLDSCLVIKNEREELGTQISEITRELSLLREQLKINQTNHQLDIKIHVDNDSGNKIELENKKENKLLTDNNTFTNNSSSVNSSPEVSGSSSSDNITKNPSNNEILVTSKNNSSQKLQISEISQLYDSKEDEAHQKFYSSTNEDNFENKSELNDKEKNKLSTNDNEMLCISSSRSNQDDNTNLIISNSFDFIERKQEKLDNSEPIVFESSENTNLEQSLNSIKSVGNILPKSKESTKQSENKEEIKSSLQQVDSEPNKSLVDKDNYYNDTLSYLSNLYYLTGIFNGDNKNNNETSKIGFPVAFLLNTRNDNDSNKEGIVPTLKKFSKNLADIVIGKDNNTVEIIKDEILNIISPIIIGPCDNSIEKYLEEIIERYIKGRKIDVENQDNNNKVIIRRENLENELFGLLDNLFLRKAANIYKSNNKGKTEQNFYESFKNNVDKGRKYLQQITLNKSKISSESSKLLFENISSLIKVSGENDKKFDNEKFNSSCSILNNIYNSVNTENNIKDDLKSDLKFNDKQELNDISNGVYYAERIKNQFNEINNIAKYNDKATIGVKYPEDYSPEYIDLIKKTDNYIEAKFSQKTISESSFNSTIWNQDKIKEVFGPETKDIEEINIEGVIFVMPTDACDWIEINKLIGRERGILPGIIEYMQKISFLRTGKLNQSLNNVVSVDGEKTLENETNNSKISKALYKKGLSAINGNYKGKFLPKDKELFKSVFKDKFKSSKQFYSLNI